MRIPAALEPLIGTWAGSGSLWYNPSEPPQTTFSGRATIVAAVQANVLSVTYTWAYDDDPQEGVILIGEQESGELQASWLDSWHMADSFMVSTGKMDASRASLLGSYAATPGQSWGWRSVIEVVNSNEWRLRMYNIPPGGKDELAFELRLSRL